MADTPEAYYRNALDLNRFGNKVQNDLRKSYNRIIVDSVEKLARINEMPLETRPKYKAARLRALLKQTTESLAKWSGKSEKTVIKELQGLAKVQVDFAVKQLEAALPAGMKSAVNSVEVSASYAESVVKKKATDLNASLLSDDLEAKVKGIPEKFSLTAKKGSQITLPNGDVLTKSFRGLAAKQADLFGRNIRDGLLSGETTQQMTRRLYGILMFEGGGKATNNQISTLVKTSVQSVSNQAAQTVYEANQDITKQYKWIATLDSRTAPECRILDQTVHNYGQGPEPPQHFGCRCRTTAVLDYEGLGVDPPKYKYAKRAGEGGSVPIGQSYGNWLSKQSASYKAKALGASKVKYFNALTKKYGPDQALKKLVREDGSAKTLKQLKKTYGKTPSKKLTAKPKSKPIPKPVSKPVPKPIEKPTITITNQDELEKKLKAAKAAERKAKAELKALKEKDPLQPTIAQLQGIPEKAKIQPVDVNNAFNLMDDMDGLAGANAKKLRKFTEQREVFSAWTTGAETRGRPYGANAKKMEEKIAFLKGNAQLKRSMELAKKRGQNNVFDSIAPSSDPITGLNQLTNSQRVAAGLGKIEEILDSGLEGVSGWGHAYFVKFVTTGKTKAFGYTLQGANHIAMKVKPFHKKIKNLTSIKKAVKESIQQAAKGTPKGNVDGDLYQWIRNKIGSKTGDSWLTTYVHEMGHQVHYAANRPAMTGKAWIPSRYGNGNYMEQFAETFVQYVFDPVELKKASPNAYKWVDDALAAALKAPL